MRTGEEACFRPGEHRIRTIKPAQATTQQRKRLAHGADDRCGQKFGQIAGNDARLIARPDRTQLSACTPREQIADGLAGGFAASAAENERAALDFALEEHAGQRMFAAEILRADADEQRAVCV